MGLVAIILAISLVLVSLTYKRLVPKGGSDASESTDNANRTVPSAIPTHMARRSIDSNGAFKKS